MFNLPKIRISTPPGVTIEPTGPKKNMSAVAREALEIKPEDQAHEAIAAALSLEPTSDPRPNPEPEPVTPPELSPEYHAGLASRMLERLNADAQRLEDALKAEQEQHETLMAALRAELTGVHKVRDAYQGVSMSLAGEAPEVFNPAPVDPAAMSAVGDKITATKRAARRRKPVQYVGQLASEQAPE